MGTSAHSSACKWRRRKEDRPAEILSAALSFFSTKGYAATRLDEVAREAGVSKGTLYLYFESKQALFKAVVVEFVLPQIEQAEETAEQFDGSIRELMINLLQQWQSHVLDTELCGISKMMIAEASNFPDLAEFYFEHVIMRARRFVARLIQQGIEQGEFHPCDIDYTARAFLTPMIFSAIWQHSLAPFDKDFDTHKYLSTHVTLFLNSITKDNKP